MSKSIIEKINSSARSLKEEDLNSWIIPELLTFYQSKINFLSNKIYNSPNEVSSASFKEEAKKELYSALNVFLFKAEHWRSGRDINPYLMTVISRLAAKLKVNQEAIKKVNIPICPFCKENSNKRESLILEDNLLRCNSCTKQAEILSDQKEKRFIYQKFALHSRKGYKCPDCFKFIPDSSFSKEEIIICPYASCCFIGELKDLTPMAHPACLSNRLTVSLQTPISSSSSSSSTAASFTIQDMIKSEHIDVDARMDIHENFRFEYQSLINIIISQIEIVKKNNPLSFQKILMLEAFKIMTEKYPDDMVSYLMHQQQRLDSPIQCKILQEYANIIENYLPTSIKKNGKEIPIVDLSDPNLGLFLGISKFENIISKNRIIHSEIKEDYIGVKSNKNYGKRLIGKLIDVIDIETGISILNQVKEYRFSNIIMNENANPGGKVLVKCLVIPPHPETGAMCFLQRCRKSLVKKINKGKK